MAKKPRQNLKLFADSGSTANFEQFGSTVAGGAVVTKDIELIQAISAWVNGWTDAVYGANKAPILEDMNALCYVIGYQLFYLFQEGIPEWNNDTTYWIGSMVRKGSTYEIYSSFVDNNVANALPVTTDNANWKLIYPVKPSALLGAITAAEIAANTIGTGNIADGAITNAKVSDVAASKITGQVNNGQISDVNVNKLVGQILNGQIADSAIGRAKLNTATGSISALSGVIDVTFNDYTFLPSITSFSSRQQINHFLHNGFFGDTIGRLAIGGTQQAWAEWRYVTSSDNPRMWAIVDKEGKIISMWEAEDPPNHGALAEGWDDEETCPFNPATLKDGERIVSVPILSAAEIDNFFQKVPKESQTKILKRFHNKIKFKGWMDEKLIAEISNPATIVSMLPNEKKNMGAQWFLRSISGRAPLSRIMEISAFSANEGRLVLNHAHADKIEPQGLSLK